jgi:hypothetical protein
MGEDEVVLVSVVSIGAAVFEFGGDTVGIGTARNSNVGFRQAESVAAVAASHPYQTRPTSR